MSLRSKYARSVRRTLGKGYHAAWYPDRKYEIGVFGRIEDDVFISYGDIRELAKKVGTDIDISVNKETKYSSLEISSREGVGVIMKAKGSANPSLPHIPEASVGLGIEFSSEGAFIISAEKVYEDQIKHTGALEEGLRLLKTRGKWDSSYRIVTGILRMPIATILISQNANTKVELMMEGTLTPSIRELGKQDISASFIFESSRIMKYAPARNASPILQLHKFAPCFPFAPRRMTMSFDSSEELSIEDEEWRLILDDEMPVISE